MNEVKNRLGYKLLAITLLCLVVGVGVYFAAHAIASKAIDAYLSNENVQQERLVQSAASLQDYVSANNVALTDKEKLDAWVAEERYVMLQIYCDGRIMYDSTMEEDMSAQDMAGGDAMQWHESFPIAFSDMAGQAVFYGFYQMQDYMVATVLAVALGTAAFAVLLLLLARRKTRYITQLSGELHILEGGDMEYPVTVRGNDELGELAQSIDDMRKAMIERQQEEEHTRRMARELVTSMSHDLRSPLTSLIGYLDIMALGKYKSEDEKARFLKNSRTKAYQIKEISDKLFEYFLLNEGRDEDHQIEAYSCVELMREMIEENLFELESAGFHVEYVPPKEPCGLQMMVDKSQLRRAFDNLFVNIRNYADKERTVTVVCMQGGGSLAIDLVNTVGSERDAGAGIGLKAAKRIVEAYHGQLEYREEDGRFIVKVTLHSAAPA